MVPVARDPTRIANKVAALFFKLLVLKPGPPHLDRLACDALTQRRLSQHSQQIANDLQSIEISLMRRKALPALHWDGYVSR
jgi:hypothetical protein